MNRLETIVGDYSAADDTERLYLFLAHRDLRDAFMEIQMAGPLCRPGMGDSRKGTGWVARLTQYCQGWWKRCPCNLG